MMRRKATLREKKRIKKTMKSGTVLSDCIITEIACLHGGSKLAWRQ